MEELVNNEPVIKSEEVDTETTATTETIEEPVATPAEEVVAVEETPAAPAEEPVAEEKTAVEEEPAVEEAEVEAEPDAEEEPEPEQENEFDIPTTKEGIIERMKQIAESDEEISRQEVDLLKSHFYRIVKAEGEAAYKQYIDDGGDPEAYTPAIDPTEQLFKEVFAIVREKRAAQHKAQEQQKEENYLKKLRIIEKIKAILDNPDEVNKSYNEFRELQNEWNSIKDVPAEKSTELWKTYQANVEKFYDTLKLNNEFRAYDFKKNLEMKTALCEAAEKLTESDDVLGSFRQLQNLHQQFREIGPVSRELREEVWHRFKEASTIINKRHQEYFESRKEEENQNLDQKTAICEIIEGYDLDSLKSFAAWNDMSEKIMALQTKWKTIGFAPHKMNQKIYDRFRAACDAFFTKKAEYFKEMRENMGENLRKKTELVEKAEALKSSTNWKKTADELIALQKEWNGIGPIPKKQSTALWSRFRAACDEFFEAKKANTSSQHGEQVDNLNKKKAIVARLAAIVPEETPDLRQLLKDAQAEWNEIGHVPFKEKDKVFQALRAQMDRLYDFLGESASKRRVERFKNTVSEGGGDRVRDKLVRQAEILQQEIKTYENNLGFLNLSKGNKGSSLIDELNHKVDKLKADLKEIKEKIKIIDEK
ncbi:MAG: DUF349 domain-containing protein [Bacteroidaceae bacterium]|nr:DUF349 domain-containing protein [Bacteroidaceae bacterium]